MKHVFFVGITVLIGLASAINASASSDAPDWFVKAAALPTPKLDPDSPAVVLLDENTLDINAVGVATERHRVVLRVLNNTGCDSVMARTAYIDKSDRCRSNKAWLVRNGSTVKSKEGSDWLDISASPELTLYGEERVKTISLKDDAATRDVFGFETVFERPLLVAQLRYTWGWKIPVTIESFHVTVPTGFVLEPLLHDGAGLATEKSTDGRSMTWTLRDQPLNNDEAFAPQLSKTEPDLLIKIVPPAGLRGFKPAVFNDWKDVALWTETISTGSCDQSTQLVAESARLTKDCPDVLSKIRVLGKRVQSIRYVAVNTDLGKGAGYKPRKASEVFARGYGDCKDKANLLRAMLREVGITSYDVEACASADSNVWSDCPSPTQFNHAILAIAVDQTIDLPSIVVLKSGQRLLFFDPTDEFTAVGDLPAILQGSNVHLLCDQGDALIELPRIPAALGHAFERKVSLVLAPNGSIIGQASVNGVGQCGVALRQQFFLHSTPEEIKEHLTSLVADRVRGSQFSENVRHEDTVTGRSGETFTFKNTRFLQPLPGDLAIAHLDVLSRRAIPNFSAKDRRSPVELKPLIQDDEIKLELPANFSTVELPASVSLDNEYGNFKSSFEVHDHTVVYKRRVELKPQLVPVADYLKLRKFFSDVAKADKAPVLLKTAVEAGKSS